MRVGVLRVVASEPSALEERGVSGFELFSPRRLPRLAFIQGTHTVKTPLFCGKDPEKGAYNGSFLSLTNNLTRQGQTLQSCRWPDDQPHNSPVQRFARRDTPCLLSVYGRSTKFFCRRAPAVLVVLRLMIALRALSLLQCCSAYGGEKG